MKAAFRMDRIGLIFLFVVLFSAQLEAFLHCEGECVPSAECRDVEDNDRIVRYLRLYQTDCPKDTICCFKDSSGVCISTESCQNRGGSCKESCEPDEEENDYLKPCGWGSCGCCVSRDSPAHHLGIERQKRQAGGCDSIGSCLDGDGICRDTCNFGEQQSGLCGSGACKCCLPPLQVFVGCDTTASCAEAGGNCRDSCNFGEQPQSGGLCGSNSCQCCLLPLQGCATNSMCLNFGGTCKQSCSPGESSGAGLCDGASCICCYVQQVCSDTSECSEAGGTCKGYCDSGETGGSDLCSSSSCSCCIVPASPGCITPEGCALNKGTCKETCDVGEKVETMDCTGSCKCCIPQEGCSLTPMCDMNDGTCKEQCAASEVAIPNACGSSSCKCCHSCHVTMQCLRIGGKCVSKYGSCGGRKLKGLCTGKNCRCCVPGRPTCWMTAKCKNAGGMCRPHKCKGKDEIPGGCFPSRCKCCPIGKKDKSCKRSKQCRSKGGKCVNKQINCKETEVVILGACKSKSCQCCAGCAMTATNSCVMSNGQCKPMCEAGEGQVDGGCTTTQCKCCYRCDTNQRCNDLNGMCVFSNAQCPDGNVQEGICDGAQCLCCVPPPPIPPPTTTTTLDCI